MAEMTPMMRQYLEIKEQNKDAILFFRLGDFYEMFNEDAKVASEELDLTLTSRDRGKPEEDRVPMCGVPYHSCDGYIARLIAKGYKVAICEQTEDPAKAKGLVKRDIIRVVTPGTVDSSMLEATRSNYLCAICLSGEEAGLCFCDITTGKTHVTAFSGEGLLDHIASELGRFAPAEAILNGEAYSHSDLVQLLRTRFNCRADNYGERRFRPDEGRRLAEKQFGKEAAAAIPDTRSTAVMALGGLLSYLYETQKADLGYIQSLEYYEEGRFLELDLTARRNLASPPFSQGQSSRSRRKGTRPSS